MEEEYIMTSFISAFVRLMTLTLRQSLVGAPNLTFHASCLRKPGSMAEEPSHEILHVYSRNDMRPS